MSAASTYDLGGSFKFPTTGGSTGSAFGANTGSAFGVSTGSAFGNSGSAFGSTGSAFGSTGSAFGANTGSAFGVSTGSAFGNTGSAFGSTGSAFGANTGSTFGAAGNKGSVIGESTGSAFPNTARPGASGGAGSAFGASARPGAATPAATSRGLTFGGASAAAPHGGVGGSGASTASAAASSGGGGDQSSVEGTAPPQKCALTQWDAKRTNVAKLTKRIMDSPSINETQIKNALSAVYGVQTQSTAKALLAAEWARTFCGRAKAAREGAGGSAGDAAGTAGSKDAAEAATGRGSAFVRVKGLPSEEAVRGAFKRVPGLEYVTMDGKESHVLKIPAQHAQGVVKAMEDTKIKAEVIKGREVAKFAKRITVDEKRRRFGGQRDEVATGAEGAAGDSAEVGGEAEGEEKGECAECGATAIGDVDTSDGNFYCAACWATFGPPEDAGAGDAAGAEEADDYWGGGDAAAAEGDDGEEDEFGDEPVVAEPVLPTPATQRPTELSSRLGARLGGGAVAPAPAAKVKRERGEDLVAPPAKVPVAASAAPFVFGGASAEPAPAKQAPPPASGSSVAAAAPVAVKREQPACAAPGVPAGAPAGRAGEGEVDAHTVSPLRPRAAARELPRAEGRGPRRADHERGLERAVLHDQGVAQGVRDALGTRQLRLLGDGARPRHARAGLRARSLPLRIPPRRGGHGVGGRGDAHAAGRARDDRLPAGGLDDGGNDSALRGQRWLRTRVQGAPRRDQGDLVRHGLHPWALSMLADGRVCL